MTEKELVKKSGFYTSFILFFVSLFWFLFSIQTSFGGYTGGPAAGIDVGINSRSTSRINLQPGTSGVFVIRLGVDNVTGIGTATGYMSGTDTYYPRIEWTPTLGTLNFVGTGSYPVTVQMNGITIPSAGSVSGKINAVQGTGTGNVLTDTTLAGVGTITASFGANGLVISPAEYASVNNATGELQAQIITITGTSTPGASKTVMSDGTGKIVDGWLSNNVTKLGTPTTSNIPEGSNLYHTSARVNAIIGSSSITSPQVSPRIILTSPAIGQFLKILNIAGDVENGTSSASVDFSAVTGSATASQLPLSLAGMTFTGDTNFPSGIWSSTGNIAIGTTTATHPFSVVSGTNRVKYTTAGSMRIGSIGDSESYDGKLTITGASATPGDDGALLKIRGTSGDEMGFGIYDSPTARDIGWISAFHPGIDNCDLALQPVGRNVAIGTTTADNILTLPIASATDPIADAWTLHCLSDYKEIGTETAEMIQDQANSKVKATRVSLFTKKALISDEEAERKSKQKYQVGIRESSKVDLALYTTETGVAMQDNSYVNELIESMWETKSDRIDLIEENKQKLIIEKKALPKFQRKNYGIVAEDAPPEAQVLREDGSLQGVDPSVLVGILWSNAQKQETRISALESEIDNLYIIIEVLAGLLGMGGSATWLVQRRKRNS